MDLERIDNLRKAADNSKYEVAAEIVKMILESSEIGDLFTGGNWRSGRWTFTVIADGSGKALQARGPVEVLPSNLRSEKRSLSVANDSPALDVLTRCSDEILRKVEKRKALREQQNLRNDAAALSDQLLARLPEGQVDIGTIFTDSGSGQHYQVVNTLLVRGIGDGSIRSEDVRRVVVRCQRKDVPTVIVTPIEPEVWSPDLRRANDADLTLFVKHGKYLLAKLSRDSARTGEALLS